MIRSPLECAASRMRSYVALDSFADEAERHLTQIEGPFFYVFASKHSVADCYTRRANRSRSDWMGWEDVSPGRCQIPEGLKCLINRGSPMPYAHTSASSN